MANSYEVHNKYIEKIDFSILILEIPKDEVEEKLAYLAREKGRVSRFLYEDFIIATCVANLNELTYVLEEQQLTQDALNEIREVVIKGVVDNNKCLDPSNLILNRNYVIKIRDEDSELGEGEKLLTDNKQWDTPLFEAPPEPDDEVIDGTVISDTDIKNIKDLGFETVKKWWVRLSQYVPIKKFNEDDIHSIFKSKFFHNRSSFNTFIVSICVVDFEELMNQLDTMGIPMRVAPPLLMHELYELCRHCNPFLTYDNAKNLFDNENNEEDEDDDNSGAEKCSCSGSSMSKYKNKKNSKSKKRFRDVSDEDLIQLGDKMKVFIIGQDKAVDSISNAVQRASVGLKDPQRPIGSFLFGGKTGIGKTKMTKVLADELIKSKKNLITIDCSEYSSDHEYAKLIGCFVPGSKVLMSDGGLKNIEDIKVGEKVITHKGRGREVEHLHEYDQDGEMIRYTTANSNIPVTTTKTHEIFAIKHAHCDKGEKRAYRVCKPTCKQEYCVNPPYENYKPSWIPAYELEKDDILVYPRYKPTGDYPNRIDLVDYIECSSRYKYDDDYVWAQEHVKVPRFIEVNEDLVRLAGYYVSEGGSDDSMGTMNFTFHSKERDYIIEVVKLIRKIFGKEVRIRIADRVEEGNTYRIYISSKIVCYFMTSLFGHNTYVKRLPSWFKDMPDNLVKGFLETAVFGDGCTVIPRRMDYSTVSPDLFSHMELLFRRLGYLSYNQLEHKPDPNHTDRYRIYIGGNQIEKLNEEFDFGIDLSDLKQTNIQRKAWIDDNYVYLQIKWLDRVNYTGKVYDLAVKDDTSYVIGTAVHNSPNGYIGHDAGGRLTNAVMKNPFSVVVFDEIEKASKRVYDLLLQVLEEGRLTDGKGKSVSFKDCIIIMTSNIGVKEVNDVKKRIGFGNAAVLTSDKREKAIGEALKGRFKPEFLNRIDEVIYFNSLNKKDYMRIIDIELYRLNENLKSSGTKYSKFVDINFGKRVTNYIYKHGIDEDFGARPLKRCIENDIATPLAKSLLTSDVNNSLIVGVDIKKDKVIFNIKDKKSTKTDCVCEGERDEGCKGVQCQAACS